MFEYLIFQEFVADSVRRGIRLEYDCDKVNYQMVGNNCESYPEIYGGDAESFMDRLDSMHLELWDDDYVSDDNCDLHSWSLTYKEAGKSCRRIQGHNAFPASYKAFTRLVYSVTEAC